MNDSTRPDRRFPSLQRWAMVWLACASIVRAQTTWDGGAGVDTSWGNAANWNNDILPAFDGTDVLTVTSGFSGNTAMTLGADRNISRLTFGSSAAPVVSLSGNTLRLTSTASSTASPLWTANTANGQPTTEINSNVRLEAGSAGTYTAHFREVQNSGSGTTFHGQITQGTEENWTLQFSRTSARGSFFLNNANNSVAGITAAGADVRSQTPGSFGGGLLTLSGGSLGTSVLDHHTTPVANNITMTGNATWSSGVQTRLTGTMDQNTRALTYAGAELTYVDYASVTATTGTTTISGATVAVSAMSKLSPGTLSLEGGRGVMVLSGSGGNGVPTWSDFSGARTYNQSGGAGTWRINSGVTDGSAGGFAARGADLVIPASGAGLSSTTFARHLALGSTAMLDGNRYANNAVRIQTDIAYAANDNYEISVLGLGTTVSANNWTFGGPVHELSGVISGDNIGMLPMQNRGNPGILRISNAANSLTNAGGPSAWVLGNTRGALTTQGGRSVGGGGHKDGSDIVVIFTSDGAFGGAADVLVNQVSSDNAASTGYLFLEDTSGLSTTFGRNFRVNATNTSTAESAGFGSWGGVVNYAGNGTSTGVIDLTGANVNVLVSAENGSLLNLGTAGGNAASLVNNRSGASLTYQIGGSGTVALNNVAFSGSFGGTPSWVVREGTLQVNQALNQGNVTVSAGATLGGSGRIGATVLGAGLVAPGASPGILAANDVDASAGTDFAFEFTQAGAPTWSTAAASGNDVLRLTAATPFVNPLDGDNTLRFYFDAPGTYQGGFFTDNNADFTAQVAGGNIEFYIAFPGGDENYNGTDYNLLPGTYVTWDVVQVASADFAGGTVNEGWTMEFAVSIPEPGTLALLALGLGGAALLGRRRR